MQVSGEFPISSPAHGDQVLSSTLHKRVHPYPSSEHGWDEKKERMDDWKLQQGNLGHEPDDLKDPDMAMYVFNILQLVL